jgi:hypothetical protein
MTRWLIVLVLYSTCASAQVSPQRNLYDAAGRLSGRMVPEGPNSFRYYDEHGHSLGTSTTVNGVTKYYDNTGRLISTMYQ